MAVVRAHRGFEEVSRDDDQSVCEGVLRDGGQPMRRLSSKVGIDSHKFDQRRPDRVRTRPPGSGAETP
jgi:hypothetical protein